MLSPRSLALPRSLVPSLALTIALLLGPRPSCAREMVLLGMADLRGMSTFRTVRKTTRTSDSAVTYRDLTPQGLQAGTITVDEPGTDTDLVFDRTEEERCVFRPTIYVHEQGFQSYTVKEVSLQMGGGQGSIERITQNWGPSTSPEELFALPTTSIEASALTTMFQTILERGGDGTSVEGFMIKSSLPAAQQGPFHVRFTVVVEDAVPWVIYGRVITVAQAGSLPTKRVLEFRSSRRGQAQMTVNGTVQVQGFPVAARHRYLLDLGTTGSGTGGNTVLLEISDPSDGSSQTFSLTF